MRKINLSACLAVALLVPGSHAVADLYGYVDSRGVAHLSNVPRSQHYYLFKREPRGTLLPGSHAVLYRAPVRSAPRAEPVNPAYRRQYSPLVTAVAREHRLDAALLHAVIAVESGYNPNARSPKGAAGLMQLMPGTARRYAVSNVWDPRENLRGGAEYLRDLLSLFHNDLSLALAAYNAGEAAVIQAGNRIPPFAETRSYVPRVLQRYDLYRSVGNW